MIWHDSLQETMLLPIPASLRASAQMELDAALASARATLRASLDEFRRECAPVVAPELTVRGRVIRPAQRVPVHPRSYYAARAGGFAKAARDAFRGVSMDVVPAMSGFQALAIAIELARAEEEAHPARTLTIDEEGDHPDAT